eukprot:NODE_951_length_1099_cov_178.760288_g907_i0.p1 GENE.NODE_951_length_1099_cov_178.760288_g907_i0~~NODE_951_length_1099_cov_178.760288_g907_i0.p1  ORF type:complete len:313 (+),score=33.97 NODE_951_length_1099_cov_178.760288_g907_i0:148-1086(+)
MSVLKGFLAGRVDEENFQKTVECVEYLHSERPNEYSIQIKTLFPHQWETLLQSIKEKLTSDKRERLGLLCTCIVVLDDYSEIWVDEEFVKFASTKTGFRVFPYPEDSEDPEAYRNAAKIRYQTMLKQTGHTFCYFNMKIGDQQQDQVVFELFTEKCPRTCENFRHLCVGDLAAINDPAVSTKPINLSYKDSRIFRIVKDGWIQGGDIVNDQGNSGYSVYGKTFPDECFEVPHDCEGVLGMANNGPNTVGSQFYVSVGNMGHSWMDRKYVAFGRVIEGMAVIRRIHELDTKPNQMPQVPVVITDCGELDLDKY